MTRKKIVAVFMTAVMLSGILTVPVMAAKKITSISLKIEDECVIGENVDDTELDITCKSDKYYVEEYEFDNEEDDWTADSVPRIIVTLERVDGYYFSVSTSGITINGGTYVTGKKESGKLIITMDLPSLAETIGELENASWFSTAGGKWSEAVNAGSYEVKLYRDGKMVGSTQKVEGTSMDFSGRMTRSGSYSFKVRAINKIKTDKKSEWIESAQVYIDEETALRLKTIGDPEAVNAASSASGTWIQDSKGWWYRNAFGGYPVGEWMQILGKWYYFDETGYMKTGWITVNGATYYLAEDGGMVTGSQTIAGKVYNFKEDGSMIK